MATCDSPPHESEEPGPTNDDEEEETVEPETDTVEPETDTVEPKGYSKRDKRLEKLRQLRLRSVSSGGTT